jgi:hypothetical protein
VPVVWWLHEPGSVGEHYLREEAKLRAAAACGFASRALGAHGVGLPPLHESPVKCLLNAIPDLAWSRQLGRSRVSLRFFAGQRGTSQRPDVFSSKRWRNCRTRSEAARSKSPAAFSIGLLADYHSIAKQIEESHRDRCP